MNLTFGKRSAGLTLIEAMLIFAVVGVMAVIFLMPAVSRARTRPPRVQCANNLKEIGLSFQIWEADNGDTYPMFISQTNGGTLEFSTGPNAWRHFQIMADELMDPKLLICQADKNGSRTVATDFNLLSNSNLSYFVGMVSNELSPQMILSGDCNVTNSLRLKNGVLALTKRYPAGWTADMHKTAGNILMGDGSVLQVDDSGLRAAVANSGVAENRVQMPVLEP